MPHSEGINRLSEFRLMNAEVLDQSSNQGASALEVVRNEALSFAERLHTIQGGVRL